MRLGLSTGAVLLVMLAPADGQVQKTATSGPAANPPIPKGAVHIVVKKAGDAELKPIFTYFPFPSRPDAFSNVPVRKIGVCRVEVSPDGSVAAITILRTMGTSLDTMLMKTLVRWRAKPGPLRVVDMTWEFNYMPPGIRTRRDSSSEFAGRPR